MMVTIVELHGDNIVNFFGNFDMDMIPMKDDVINFVGIKERYNLTIKSRKMHLSYYDGLSYELQVVSEPCGESVFLDGVSVEELKMMIERLLQKDMIRDKVIPHTLIR